ncbi:MAG: magnesium transporter, partial [Candidatus Babeliales bacterium]
LSDKMKMTMLACMSERDQVEAFQMLSADALTDLFDIFSDEELKTYLNLLHKQDREKILSLLQFAPESAGGIMHTDVLSLRDDFTVDKSIKLIQRLRPKRDVHQQIFVTDRFNKLVGHINLEDLVLQKPVDRIESFVRKNELTARTDEDQESIAAKMVHYGLMTVPVVDKNNYFLGIIPSETLVDVLVEEASEDVQKMAALTPIKQPYFEVSFFRLLYERGYILVGLLLAESFSGTIMRVHEASLNAFLLSFVPMLISAGGNTSSQTSAVAIQGMASGEISFYNMTRFLRREFYMACFLALLLSITAFLRVFFTSGVIWESIVISLSLGMIVMVSVTLGSAIPFILKRFNIDPAFSAGPFLATLMDILGILIYCYLIKILLF